MKNMIKIAGALALAGVVSVSAMAPASAASHYSHWRPHAHHWTHSYGPWGGGYYAPAYYGWGGPGYYYNPGYYYDPGPAIIGGIFGAVVGSAISHGHHYRR